jgi:hypothetical protein
MRKVRSEKEEGKIKKDFLWSVSELQGFESLKLEIVNGVE